MLFVVFAMVVVACGDTSDDGADDVIERDELLLTKVGRRGTPARVARRAAVGIGGRVGGKGRQRRQQ